ncbi:MAG: 23S rRNA (guanosine(2251)-2'-O)-methyltransferase RlmB [Deltaproteobacteria bacterium RIFCSPLOWO2_02_FULL_44_10]|nr:MAG: 23S rRNA (guanosine(2251)-2'-O)-methyltransferase RlmB [Deltaproteobacteria bacterium RIFCSPHIGHO2_02_FULL_44_16]OGQ45135.1 MAG: 23S rRNA (guanosine(2251)-2'-O)-methyltransferase RlmB [Deltaproteobacteria bacterium RIFCSPLOWO2_02_FULL_44_10]
MKTEIICGKNAIIEVLRAGKRKCFEIYLASGKKEKTADEMEMFAREYNIPYRLVSREEIEKISRVEKNQGIAARVEAFAFSDLKDILASSKEGNVLLILDGVLDPQNLGSLLRTAHQLGVAGVCLPKDNSAPVGPATTRAASGATEWLSIVQVTNVTSTINLLKEKGYWIYGAEGGEEKNLFETDFKNHPIALVLGGEGKGMRRLVKESCDVLISIPMSGKLDSLNVSAAGAIIMSQVISQRSK